MAASEENERCLPGEVSNLPQNLIICSPGNCAWSCCLVPATTLTPELLGLVGSIENLCLFPFSHLSCCFFFKSLLDTLPYAFSFPNIFQILGLSAMCV